MVAGEGDSCRARASGSQPEALGAMKTGNVQIGYSDTCGFLSAWAFPHPQKSPFALLFQQVSTAKENLS